MRTLTADGRLLFAPRIARRVFSVTRSLVLLVVAATIGVLSPSGGEIGPFLSIEQSALAQLVPDQKRTGVFAWYNLVGSFATALGALGAGWLAQVLQVSGVTVLNSYRVILIGYAGMGLLLGLVFPRLSPQVEAPLGRD